MTGTYYQINTQSALTWAQADASCKQQASSLLSITDPVQQAVISGEEPLPPPTNSTEAVRHWTNWDFYLFKE